MLRNSSSLRFTRPIKQAQEQATGAKLSEPGIGFSVLPSYILRVSKKSARIAAMIENLRGTDLDAHYLGYFECFNQQLFYEAHDVLEELWLAQRRQGNDLFYKGLIQLAGAFVHLQKNRLKPAAALFRLAESNLEKYPPVHEHLDNAAVLRLITCWLGELERGDFTVNPLRPENAPRIELMAVLTRGARA